ncbi:MAG: class I SAM-dependent methyltransferase [Desulfobacterales bacterium]|nr:class I SAM-dependent methyltransferase [Desulfobacterales bacterium]
MEKLTKRQQREREYYAEYSRTHDIKEITFDPVLREERRPWNPYWFVYELSIKEFDHGRKKLLDFGCGQGVTSVRFAKIGYDVWGFDISPDNINIAKRHAEKYGFGDKISFSVYTAEHLNYYPEQFDIIVGIDILHHVEIRSAVKECHRILKKNGIAIFREHIEVPLFDRIRNSRIVTAFYPKNKSFDKHITEDERKLTVDDIYDIKEVFNDLSIQRFVFLSRLKQFFRKADDKRPSVLEKLDYFIFDYFPFLRNFGGGVVLILRK